MGIPKWQLTAQCFLQQTFDLWIHRLGIYLIHGGFNLWQICLVMAVFLSMWCVCKCLWLIMLVSLSWLWPSWGTLVYELRPRSRLLGVWCKDRRHRKSRLMLWFQGVCVFFQGGKLWQPGSGFMGKDILPCSWRCCIEGTVKTQVIVFLPRGITYFTRDTHPEQGTVHKGSDMQYWFCWSTRQPVSLAGKTDCHAKNVKICCGHHWGCQGNLSKHVRSLACHTTEFLGN